MGINLMEVVTQRIIERLEEAIKTGGTAPWVKPWNGLGVARNYITQRPYRGINHLLLQPGEYLTFNQFKALQQKNKDIKLRKGSKGEMIVFYKFLEKEEKEVDMFGNEETKKKTFPILKKYTVFHLSNFENLPSKEEIETYDHLPIDEIDETLTDYYQRENIKLNVCKVDNAFYSPTFDKVTVPTMEQFEMLEEYYSTLFHETVHSTGHSNRLDRFEAGGFGSDPYAKEELVAEIGSCLLSSHFHIDIESVTNNSIAYLSGWLNRLKDDVTLIVSAANQAQKAVDLILGTTFDDNEDEVKDGV